MAKESPLHIAMLPWLAFGHMIPFLNLSIAGHRISFISTPRNISRLLPKVPPNLLLQSLIKFINLPLPHVDGLPQDAEATVDLPDDQIPLLKLACDNLSQPIHHFLQQDAPHWIIHDFNPYWIVDIAANLNIPRVFFSVYCSAFQTFMGFGGVIRRPMLSPECLTVKPDWIPFPSTVAFTPREASAFFARNSAPSDDSGLTSMGRLARIMQGCAAVATRSCAEYDGPHLELLHSLHSVPVIPVGLLPPATPELADHNYEARNILRWLDTQKPRSVVFVSFGSEYKLTEREVQELAQGIELSGLPFLWALRSPAAEALPQGFARRTEGRGLVSFGWAPQLEILAHPSVGGSLFHSGWGSIVETLRYGHALVLLPCIMDQGLNARFAVEKGVGVEVERDVEDGSLSGDKIARALITAMVSGEGEEMRARAREMGAAVFADQALHDQYVMGFVDYLQMHCKHSSDA